MTARRLRSRNTFSRAVGRSIGKSIGRSNGKINQQRSINFQVLVNYFSWLIVGYDQST